MHVEGEGEIGLGFNLLSIIHIIIQRFTVHTDATYLDRLATGMGQFAGATDGTFGTENTTN